MSSTPELPEPDATNPPVVEPSNPPVTEPTNPPANPISNSELAAIQMQLAALPETIAKAIKEMIPQPKVPKSAPVQQKSEPAQQPVKPDPIEPPRRKLSWF